MKMGKGGKGSSSTLAHFRSHYATTIINNARAQSHQPGQRAF